MKDELKKYSSTVAKQMKKAVQFTRTKKLGTNNE
jgi:hypothetical protein